MIAAYRKRSVRISILSMMIALFPLFICAEEDERTWRVAQAPLRFSLQVDRSPTHPSAGYFVEILDGGLLPEPAFRTYAFSENGTPLDSYVLWHNPEGKLALVIEYAENTSQIELYLQQAQQYRLWSTTTDLTPSGILVTDPTTASFDAAADLAQFGRVNHRVHYLQKAGVRRAPLSIGGDETGRPRPASFYHLVHVVSQDPGRTWIAPFILEGDSYIRVNRQRLSPYERIEKWGGTGDWVDIQEGPNLLEIFHTVPGERPFYEDTRGLVYLTWRTPNATMEELGGVRSDELPMAGTSRMETRVIRENEIMQSGHTSVAHITARNHIPIGLIQYEEPRVFWVEEEVPLLIYHFEARLPPGQQADFTWVLPDGTRQAGKRLKWIFPALQEYTIQLQTTSARGTLSQDYVFFGFSTRETRLDRSSDLQAFRAALLNMVTNIPAESEAIFAWPASIWRNLIRTLEPQQDPMLLEVLFTYHENAMAEHLSEPEMHALQDVFIERKAAINPEHALRWIRRFGRSAEDETRRDMLTIQMAEVYLFYLHDLDRAEEILRDSERARLDTPQRLLRIRLGDIALLRGDLNLATRYYAEVQNHTRMRRAEGNPLLQEAIRPLLGPATEQELSHDWRVRAVVETAASESVQSLLAQDYVWEAREMLYEWERHIPLSKISGDFLLRKAQLYARMQNPIPAIRMLRAFCTTVEGSNYLPEAAMMLLEMMRTHDWPHDEIREIGEKLQDQLAFHPVASEIQDFLESL